MVVELSVHIHLPSAKVSARCDTVGYSSAGVPIEYRSFFNSPDVIFSDCLIGRHEMVCLSATFRRTSGIVTRRDPPRRGLQRFLTEIHSSIENGNTLRNIENQLRTERFWSGMKIVYVEVKDLISINIGK